MNAPELIKKKRNGESLTIEEISFMISGYVDRKIPDYQFAAFLMAAFIVGLDKWETSALTSTMLFSGKVLNLSKIPGNKIDKHSTGGIGDKTSLIIAPIVAAAGVKVPMISGRGLGHTGGTLDKLESIPGFRTDLNLTQYKHVLRKCGAVMVGQTKDIAPADKMIYALRDVTATVESIPLITASIMSKKLAEGIDGLVLDVKTGSGAFMKELSQAKILAKSLMDTAVSFDKKVIAFITDMNQPLGTHIGNWLEVVESVEILQGKEVDDLKKVSLNLSGAMLYLGGKVESIEEGIELSNEMIISGKAFDKFKQIAGLQFGDVSYLDDMSKYHKPKYHQKVIATKGGNLKSIENYEIGMASLELGAGRFIKDDIIDPTAGIIVYKKIGDKIKKGEVIAEIFTNKKKSIDLVEQKILNALELSKEKVKKPKLIKKIMT